MKKQSMTVGGFRITAWMDPEGLMRMEVKALQGNAVISALDTPWEHTRGTVERIAFTDNATIIGYLADPERQVDTRTSPARLRRGSKDPVFVKWFKAQAGGDSPLAWARAIEEDRRREGRDPATGAMIRRNGDLVCSTVGGS